MKMKPIVAFVLGGIVTSCLLLLVKTPKDFVEITGEECTHGTVEKYDCYAPTISRTGLMTHYACCDCHAAFRENSLTTKIGNTITDRSKIEIRNKTSHFKIDKTTISDDEIVLVNEAHVYGLDQTIWAGSDRGVGSGNIDFYNVDGKSTLRISTEEVTKEQQSSLDYSNFGYSEIGFSKELTGRITAQFNYKIYDLNTEQLGSAARVQAVWIGLDGNKYTTDMELNTDNGWHTVNVSSLDKYYVKGFALKIYHFTGEMYISGLKLTSTALDFPSIFRENTSVKWEPVTNADYYIVNDSNNYPNEIRVEASSVVDGLLSYRPTAAGKHDIYVTAHSNNPEYDPAPSNIVSSIEVDPVFFYDNMVNMYEINKNAGYSSSQIKQTYNSSTWNEDDSKYYAYYTDSGTFSKNESDRLRFNSVDENSNLARIVREAKELGTNVIHVSHPDGYLSGALEDNQELKTIMDYCHANNLKTTVMVNPIYSASANGPDRDSINQQVKSYLKTYGKSLLEHPAFYGFTLRDEPPRQSYNSTYQSVEYVSWAARAVLDYYKENYGNINFSCERPYFVCALLQYGGTNIFHCEWDYEVYVETWLRITGLDYFATDIYTYTTQQQYGDNPEGIDINYNIFMKLKKKYDNLRMHLTVTANNDVFARASCNQYDIFGSTLYAAAMNNYGVSRYTYYPAMHTYHWSNGVVNRDGSHTSKYEWVREAQAQFDFIHDKLYGYKPTALSYSTSGKYGDYSWTISGKKENTNTRRMDVTLSNGSYDAQMIVNYNSQLNNISSFSVDVPSGKIYYKFGLGEASTEYLSTGGSVTLTNGTAILIMDASERQVLSNLNEMVAKANSLSIDTKEAKAQFSLLSNNIEKIYTKLEPGMRSRVKGYNEYSAKASQVSGDVSILYDGSYRYYETTSESWEYFHEDSDPTFGSMQIIEWGEGKSGNIQLALDSFLVGEDWSLYKSVGFFARFSAAPTDNTFLIVDNWAKDWVPAKKTVIDEATNTYFYEFDMSTITEPFVDNTYFQVYFHPGDGTVVTMNRVEFSSIVKFTHNTQVVDTLINNALNLSTTSNRDIVKFATLANRIDETLAAMGDRAADLISRYSEYQEAKTLFASKGKMIDNGTNVTTYEPGVSGDWPLITANGLASNEYGYFNTHTYQSKKDGGTVQLFYQSARYKSWKSYSSIGFYVQVDSNLYYQAYFNDGEKNLFADPVLVDETNRIYYIEISLSGCVSAFTANPWICINLGGGAYTQSVAITNIVGIY